ncbi:hypothetical protein E0Z10_g7442 [Xylaria hypoxylon]|uniref:Uncharacterized protein n=1 Tax=Xylaria hypoxylon TaxID=37992 RepID=A0A4Z0YQ65_9PEZI|nr:hypothetical protein E0Z10_g7442 [Xylaria hypoxylon]
MADNKEVKKEDRTGFFDESLLDPRLRSDAVKTYGSETNTKTQAPGPTPGPTPAPALTPASASALFPLHGQPWDDAWIEDMVMDDENTVLPESPFKSLDFIIASGNTRADERLWLIGLQLGIGLGIYGAREAVLNEMQNENTVFSRRIQTDPSDPDPYRMRMELGQRCQTGFDLRVANRAANRYIRNCNRIADMVVYNGITTCLPETGNHVMGTSMLFSEEDVARCHANSRVINEWVGMDKDPNTEQPVLPTASFMGDGVSIGGVDMTRLSGTAALIANAATNGVGNGGPRMRNEQYMPRPTLDVACATQDPHQPSHPENDGAFKAKHDGVDRGKDAPNDKPEAELRA